MPDPAYVWVAQGMTAGSDIQRYDLIGRRGTLAIVQCYGETTTIRPSKYRRLFYSEIELTAWFATQADEDVGVLRRLLDETRERLRAAEVRLARGPVVWSVPVGKVPVKLHD